MVMPTVVSNLLHENCTPFRQSESSNFVLMHYEQIKESVSIKHRISVLYTRATYLLASHWFINNGIEWYLGIGTK